jgi:sugar phosphate isomerase/epimerase
MDLSVSTDYVRDTGDPSPYLGGIAGAGFTHVHWCHQWNTDFLYSAQEIEQIREWLAGCGLRPLDLHGSVGPEKNWASSREPERLAGVELARNRIEMTARLGADVTVMHIPAQPGCEPLRRSLAELERPARTLGVRIAIENGSFEALGQVLAGHGPDYVGLCYDAGHGNLAAGGLDRLDALKDRLISVHLHDNDGSADQHNLPFSGTVDWARLARIMAASAYSKCVSLEVSMHSSGIRDEPAFLARAFEAGKRFSRMVDEQRKALVSRP